MSTRNYNHGWVPGHYEVTISGSFAPDTANAPTTLRPTKCLHWSVVRVSQGLFRVTFSDKFQELINATATLQLAVAAARFVQIGAYNSTNNTLDIRVTDAAGAVQDIAANADNRVNFTVKFSNTTT